MSDERPKHERPHGDDLRGASRLVVDATEGVMALVQELHATIASGPAILGSPLAKPARLVTEVVYGGLRGVTKMVGSGLDAALGELTPLLGASAPGPERDAIVAALNGVLGDHLAASGNPLAIEMRLCHAGVPLDLGAAGGAPPGATGKILVLVHGSCMNDRQWRREGHDHGEALAEDLGFTPLYLRYNSGLHVSTNGRAFAALLEELTRDWPERIDELVLLGHSMGGLVARSACHVGEELGHGWRSRITKLVTIGTPHHGAPLERGGSWLHALLGVSRYSAPFARLGRLRSAGVTDLRFGNVLDEHWEGRDHFAVGADPRRALELPRGVACSALAGSLSEAPGPSLRGDGLVPVASALGEHEKPELTLAFPERFVDYGAGHLDLLNRREVYDVLRRWLAPKG